MQNFGKTNKEYYGIFMLANWKLDAADRKL